MRILDTGVKLCARKLNEAKAQADKLDEELVKNLDELKDLARERDALDDMLNGNNDDARRIEKLTKEIEEINETSEQQLYYRVQLNHVKDRLEKNSLVTDGQMSALSDTVDASERELAKCERVLGEVQSTHTKALRDLENAVRDVELERQQRNSELATLRCKAENSERMEKWGLALEGSRPTVEESFGGSKKHDKDKNLPSVRERKAELAQLRSVLDAKTATNSNLEESFKNIKQATGVNSLTEMLEKLTRHQEHRDRLLAEKKDTEDRLNAAKQSLENAHQRFEKAKANGFGDTELNRDVTNELEESIALEKVKGKVALSLNDRMEGVLVGLRQGGMGLYQRLLPFHPSLLEGEAPQLSESSTASAIQAAYDTMEMLKVTEHILDKMLDAVGGVERISSDVTTAALSQEGRYGSIESLENPNLRESNCRIQTKEDSLRTHKNGDKDNDEGGLSNDVFSDDTSDANNRIPSRSFLKHASQKVAGGSKKHDSLEHKREKLLEKRISNDGHGASDSNKNGDTVDENGANSAIKKRLKEADDRTGQLHNMPVGVPKVLSTTNRMIPFQNHKYV